MLQRESTQNLTVSVRGKQAILDALQSKREWKADQKREARFFLALNPGWLARDIRRKALELYCEEMNVRTCEIAKLLGFKSAGSVEEILRKAKNELQDALSSMQ
jgi:hypothetical protein